MIVVNMWDKNKRDMRNKKQELTKLIQHIQTTGEFTANLGETVRRKRLENYNYIEKVGKLYMFVGKGGYTESFTAEQIWENRKYNKE